MGAGQSVPSQDQLPTRALHVLRVTPSSPASQTNIEPFFDFVVGFEGDSLSAHKQIDASELEKIVESHEEKTLNLLVWNGKSRTTRLVPIVPSRAWSLPHSDIPNPKEPESEPQPSLLGLSMRMCEPEFAVDTVWHVLDVLEGSPAESAGLVPYGDWIIGWSGGVLSSEGDFYDLVESHIEKPLRVYVYSLDFDTLREVVLVPNRQWGGEGLLGCVFGFGLLHRIPPQPADREPGAIPPELHEPEDEYEQQELFVPADVPEPQQPHSEDQYPDWRQETFATHGNDHEHHQDEYSPSSTPDATFRTSSWAAQNMSTPTRNRPLGPLLNGTGMSDILSARVRTPVPSNRSFNIGAFGGPATDESGGERDNDHDGQSSISGTETAEVGSGRTSLGSLTSVD